MSGEAVRDAFPAVVSLAGGAGGVFVVLRVLLRLQSDGLRRYEQQIELGRADLDIARSEIVRLRADLEAERDSCRAQLDDLRAQVAALRARL